jgi:hypothetical protein
MIYRREGMRHQCWSLVIVSTERGRQVGEEVLHHGLPRGRESPVYRRGHGESVFACASTLVRRGEYRAQTGIWRLLSFVSVRTIKGRSSIKLAVSFLDCLPLRSCYSLMEGWLFSPVVRDMHRLHHNQPVLGHSDTAHALAAPRAHPGGPPALRARPPSVAAAAARRGPRRTRARRLGVAAHRRHRAALLRRNPSSRLLSCDRLGRAGTSIVTRTLYLSFIFSAQSRKR